MIILYWAQNPYSKGAAVLCQHVLQKPIYEDDEKEESDKRQQQHGYYDYTNYQSSTSPPVYTIPGATVDDCASSSSSSSATSSSSFDHPPSPEEMTLTIETPHPHHQSILDGYTPTLQESDRASSHKVRWKKDIHIHTHTSENVSCSMLHCMTPSADFIFCAGFLHRR